MKPRRIDPEHDDMAALLALIRDAFADMEGRIDPPSSVHTLDPHSLQAKARVETGFVIEEGRNPIACLFCRPEPPDTLYLGKLAIRPSHQGHGFGWQLLGQAEALAGQLGFHTLRLETRIELTDNHVTFTAWGFEKTAEKRHPGFDRTTSIEMRKRL